jgi:hypothetical protein
MKLSALTLLIPLLVWSTCFAETTEQGDQDNQSSPYTLSAEQIERLRRLGVDVSTIQVISNDDTPPVAEQDSIELKEFQAILRKHKFKPDQAVQEIKKALEISRNYRVDYHELMRPLNNASDIMEDWFEKDLNILKLKLDELRNLNPNNYHSARREFESLVDDYEEAEFEYLKDLEQIRRRFGGYPDPFIYRS